MKIIHVIPTLGGGGAEILLGNIALEQVKRGNQVIIILLEPLHFTYSNFPLKEELEQNVKIFELQPTISFSFFRNRIEMNISEFENIVSTFKPDVIHSHLFIAELVSRYKIHKSIKYFSHCHDNMSQFDLSRNKSFKRALTDYLEMKWLSKRYKECKNSFIAISPHTYDYFSRKLPNSLKANLVLLRNAIECDRYFTNLSEREDSKVKLVSVGNLVEKKGHSFLIDVVFCLVKLGYDVHLDILGFGPLENELQNKIQTLSLDSYVTLRGNVSNVNEFMSNSDIYVHGAIYEPFGLVLIEAMASSLPVVATNGKGNRELIVDGQNGFLINERDVQKFTDKIVFLISNVNERRIMSKRALQFSKEFDIKKYVDDLELIYLK